MRNQAGVVSALPSKRLYHSIIADYGLNQSICELVDNAIDIWSLKENPSVLSVDIDLNLDQQIIEVTDNAGGVKGEELSLLVAPGETSNSSDAETIGYFGVGTKRAVVALSQEIRITTRYQNSKTYEVGLDDGWLDTDEWDLPYFEVADLAPDNTRVTLQRLRSSLSEGVVDNLQEHLAATYAKILKKGSVDITLNGNTILPLEFENWAYPPEFEPRKYKGKLQMPEGREVYFEVIAGLVRESSPAGGEYGVYVYCNDRLIGRALRTMDVGFVRGLAGQPHPSISITRVMVSLKGSADLMPWNSSKSNINPGHRTFIALRDWLVQVVKDYSSLARRLEGSWPTEVFNYDSGNIVCETIKNVRSDRKSYLPPLPTSKPRYVDRVASVNRRVISEKPWTLGLSDAIVAVELISRQKLKSKNRIMLILLDSTLEIALKEFIVNESGQYYSDQDIMKLFQSRNKVVTEAKKHLDFPDDIWDKINYYYGLRSKLIHERSIAEIHDDQINDYWDIVEEFLDVLFGLSFDA